MTVLKTLQPHEAADILSQLARGASFHSNWLKDLHRVILCHGTFKGADLLEDAHCHCEFGQWFYRHAHPLLHEHPLFIRVAETHHRMHNLSRHLAKMVQDELPLTSSDYDTFIDSSIELQTLLCDLQFEIRDSLCTIDPLTGVCNRQGMIPSLEEEQQRSLRTNQSCSLVMLDLDHFKAVNDRHGHRAADQVLRSAVKYFVKTLRPYDSIYRYGGEEFLLCLPNIEASQAVSILERLRAGLEILPIKLESGEAISITASFGISTLKPDISVEESISVADYALYQAKNAGRNRVHLWEGEVYTHAG